MIQVSESRVAEVLDDLASRSSSDMALDMAVGAVHMAFRTGLIGSAEFHRRLDALDEVRYGTKKEDA